MEGKRPSNRVEESEAVAGRVEWCILGGKEKKRDGGSDEVG